jgi:Cu-Zn family superoxide dismutase
MAMRITIGCLFLFGCASTTAREKAPPQPTAKATVSVGRAKAHVRSKRANGYIFITALGGAIKAQGSVQGLPGGKTFGLHVHDKTSCDGTSADLNPDRQNHGGPADAQSHVGDLGNITADASGQAVVSLIKAHAKLDNGPSGLLGRVLVVHERFDDFKTQPEGDAGGIIACGLIAPE